MLNFVIKKLFGYGKYAYTNGDVVIESSKHHWFSIINVSFTGMEYDKTIFSRCGKYIILLDSKRHEVSLVDISEMYSDYIIKLLKNPFSKKGTITVDLSEKVRYTHFLNNKEIDMWDPYVVIDHFLEFIVENKFQNKIVKIKGEVYDGVSKFPIRQGWLEEDLDYFF